MSSRFRTPGLAALAALPLFAGGWLFHSHLTKALPGINAEVAAPTEVRLWFSEKPEVGLSSIKLLAADSSAVAVGAAKATDDTLSFVVPVTGAMKPGRYTVQYRTAGKDGHPVRGRYGFTVKP